MTSGGVLVIEKCRDKCPRGYELEVEVLVPVINRISLANGGRIQSSGSFARQAELVATVRHGGTIDARALAADRVTAMVEQGGRILTVPRASLFASVIQGGVVTYWGNAPVKSSIEHGGVVGKGRAEELNMPLADVGPPIEEHEH